MSEDRTLALDVPTLNELIRQAPFHRLLDVNLVEAEPGRVRMRLDPREELIGNVLIQALHGGVISGLVDLACGIAVVTQLGYPCPTIDLRVDFLRPAFPDRPLFADARVIRAGASVAFTEVDVTDGAGREVAKGSAVYSTVAFKAAAREG